MILLLDTSAALCRLSLIEGGERLDTEWMAERELAHGLLGFIESELGKRSKGFGDISALGAFRGPGSFTGLRIGLTVLNTLADALQVPIVGAEGPDWHAQALARIDHGENDQIVMPLYSGEAHITAPRK